MATITIDEKVLEVDNNLTIIQAARNNGIDIPHFCWHPQLSIAGNCRMCLVEVEKMPKLAIACSTQVANGMIVHTANPRVIKARQAVMEFLLINHPLDFRSATRRVNASFRTTPTRTASAIAGLRRRRSTSPSASNSVPMLCSTLNAASCVHAAFGSATRLPESRS